MSESGVAPANSAVAVSRTESLVRKFIVTFSAMFLVPLLVAVYLFTAYASGTRWSPAQIIIVILSVILLGTAGFLAIRSVVMALMRALRDAEAIANGDISRRLGSDGTSEINQLAKHFNQVIGRLEQTVNSLQSSRKLTHDLLAQLCATGSQPGDMTGIFETCLNTLLSMAGLQAGAIFLVSPGGKTMKVRVLTGLPEALKAAVIPFGHGVAGWVASHGQMATVSESMPWKMGELSQVEKCMSCSLHVPMTATGRTRGVISIGLREGQREIPADDILTIRSLANQVAVALENAELKRKEERTYIETVAALAAAVEARDRYTRGHSRRVTEFSVAIARNLGKPEWFVKDLESAALLHDIGKIGFSDIILCNSGPIPPDGLPLIRNHPITGENILKPVGSLARLCTIVRHHHEKFDGSGYPDRLKGEDIPLAARMITVADSFDAMISERPYKTSRNREDAMAELIRCSGTQFDPACVEAFLGHLGGNSQAGVLLST
ncbi:MAG: metal dependent phosphohydrolase [Deltaproteobacteria bacterium]|nr:metal dependent phosphohydrolase [Deltaproteobacteria bacterium]